ncbi:MAG: lipid-A-disaccharide synthase [Halieaceae bacterium MED-G27]|jgi:lipid-A-disaccharide synthase|nr:lipid-A-disaccharide synthase [Halieaceae bacterium]OUT64202.1 MAG: lipid-A-disaccharide synthase [Cellvibrionales bacterium TMED21]PDH37000.1 MAG: lipid-A-disaccharide synthase [Halieaceae bacterium MED-G27]|tara:strand:- start:9 stop:1157 length:1149 start_codon:yes stop_codon:yes gene_type:complete
MSQLFGADIGVLAGETSGDILGAAVLSELLKRDRSLQFSGIGGPLMADCGLESMVPMDRLSVFGLIEPLKRLPELLRIRRDVTRHMQALQPQLFLGIDSPDFNLTLEQNLRRSGITTAHLVSPSVWAWRSSRVKKVQKAVDLMLCLLPFEQRFYEDHGVPSICVGHPLIEIIEALPSKADARRHFAVSEDDTVVACLPGSRAGEVAHLAPVFADVLRRLLASDNAVTVLVPAASDARLQQIRSLMPIEDVRFQVFEGDSRLAMVASDSVLCASGTTTLEAMLIGRPMVIGYRMAWLSWQILSRMVNTPHVGLPNILCDYPVVPELLQHDATEENLYRALLESLGAAGERQREVFAEASEAIGRDFPHRSCDALWDLMLEKTQ